MKLKFIAALITGSMISFNAAAQNYVSLGIGTVDVDDTKFAVAPGTIDTDFDSGTGVTLAFGRQFTGFRAELEYSYRESDVDSHSLNGSPTLPGSAGEIEATALMLNAYYDFMPGATFNPYLGAGIGAAEVEADGFGVDAIPDVLDDYDTGLAYQFIAGVSFAATPSLDLFGEYRYMATDDVEVTTSAATGAVSTNLDYDSNNFLVGLRFKF